MSCKIEEYYDYEKRKKAIENLKKYQKNEKRRLRRLKKRIICMPSLHI